MAKRICIAVGTLVMTVLILLLLLPADTFHSDPGTLPSGPSVTTPSSGTSGSTTRPTTSATEPTTVPSTVPTIPTTAPTAPPTTAPTAPPTTAPTTPPTTQPPKPGQIRLYTCDEQRSEIYARLAVEYYTDTGIEVIVLTPAEGESCGDALERYMVSDAPPTVFCIHKEATLQKWADNLLDLRSTAVAEELYAPAFGMYSGEKLLALPIGVDWFGYIYNAEKLGDAGFTREDLTDYAAMEYITEYITSQKNALGAYAFGKPNFSDTGDEGLAALLSTVFHDPDDLRSFIDLYIGNTRNNNTALSYFRNSKIVFYAGTTASFDAVLELGMHKLELLPAFVDGSNAMHYTCDQFWAVNNAGYPPDIRETLAFLHWMVTARYGEAAPIDALQLLSPYQDGVYVRNALEKTLRTYMATEPVRLQWNSCCVAAEDYTGFCNALAAYFTKPSDTTWEAVKKYMQ